MSLVMFDFDLVKCNLVFIWFGEMLFGLVECYLVFICFGKMLFGFKLVW